VEEIKSLVEEFLAKEQDLIKL